LGSQHESGDRSKWYHIDEKNEGSNGQGTGNDAKMKGPNTSGPKRFSSSHTHDVRGLQAK
jgi:hypothetical protein